MKIIIIIAVCMISGCATFVSEKNITAKAKDIKALPYGTTEAPDVLVQIKRCITLFSNSKCNISVNASEEKPVVKEVIVNE